MCFPIGDWRVGCKHLYDLFSGGLTYRTKDERRKLWDEQQRLAVTSAASALSAFDRAQGGLPASKLSEELKKSRVELEGRVALLKELGKNYEDVGAWYHGCFCACMFSCLSCCLQFRVPFCTDPFPC